MEYHILVLVWLHFFSDFVLQTDYMALNKSKSNKVLATHVLLYSILFLFFGFWFAVINGILHFCTDWITSRWTSRLWSQEKRHQFFVVIGLDQAIHLTCLFTTYYWMAK